MLRMHTYIYGVTCYLSQALELAGKLNYPAPQY